MFAPSKLPADPEYKRLTRPHAAQQSTVWLARQIDEAGSLLQRKDLTPEARTLLEELRVNLSHELVQIATRESQGIHCSCCE